MQSDTVKHVIFSLTSQDYRMGMEKSTDSKDTTYIYPNSIENEDRFMKVAALVAGVKGELKCILLTI